MERIYFKHLLQWKNKKRRKPLIIRGARQTGKTWLLKELGAREYKNCAYINFEDEPNLQNLFADDFDIKRIVNVLQIATGVQISADNTLIVFDEIQSATRGTTALKYFCEKAPQYHIAAAGSLLGVAMHTGTSFPVGKVDFLDINPLNFEEYLAAQNELDLISLINNKDWASATIFKNRYIEHLKNYMFVGGMPEAVAAFAENKNYEEVRSIQKNILLSYENDFSKHAPTEIVPRIRMVWQSIHSQLARENKKFIYSALQHGARAKNFEIAIQWLVDCGLVCKCNRISKPSMPLSVYSDLNVFKLFMVDIGLLAALSDLDIKTIIEGSRIFEEFKGSLTEQFVFQQLKSNNDNIIAYWTNDRSTAEVDFVVQNNGKIIPIEVKSGENLRSKSFRFFCEKYKPENAVRTSLSDFRKEDWLTNIPLYGLFADF